MGSTRSLVRSATVGSASLGALLVGACSLVAPGDDELLGGARDASSGDTAGGAGAGASGGTSGVAGTAGGAGAGASGGASGAAGSGAGTAGGAGGSSAGGSSTGGGAGSSAGGSSAGGGAGSSAGGASASGGAAGMAGGGAAGGAGTGGRAGSSATGGAGGTAGTGAAGSGGASGASGSGGAPADAGRSYVDEVLADAPLLYWRFGEGGSATSAVDSSGNARNGTYLGVALGAPGALAGDTDGAASFDGVNSRVVLGDDLDFVGTAKHSVELWVRPSSSPTSFPRLVGKETFSPVRSGWTLLLSNGRASFERWSGASLDNAETTGPIASSRFVHLVGTYDGATIALFVDGQPVSSVPASVALPGNMASLIAGDAGVGNAFSGVLDELAIYGDALSLQRVQAHFSRATAP